MHRRTYRGPTGPVVTFTLTRPEAVSVGSILLASAIRVRCQDPGEAVLLAGIANQVAHLLSTDADGQP
jgi:hypothetical protein